MPRVTCARARNPCQAPNFQALLDEQQPASPEIRAFWDTLSYDERQQLLQVAKKALFRKIRASYCSRCYGLFALRYEELANGSTGDCPACQEYYAGLTVIENGALSLDPSVLRSQPFTTFTEAKARERERELQFMTGDICGSGWHKSKGQTVCTLHTSPVPVEALLEYWTNLPDEHRSTLFSMREEDFVAELDAHMKYHLKICRDCRSNVVRAYKDLKPLARDKPSAEEQLELCADHVLSVADGCVSVRGVGSAEFFERAEEVEDFKATDAELGDDMSEGDKVRHAETPELAQEALVDSVVLIFKSQVEVAFREQTAGHNALLLFVHLVLQMMEEQLQNSSRELAAKQAEAELLELVAEDKKKADKRSSKKKKKGGKAGKAEPDAPCTSCAALQRPDSPSCPRPSSPRHPPCTPTRDIPVHHVPPPQHCTPRSASPPSVPPHDHPPQPSGHASPLSRSSEDENCSTGAGWEVQARGRKRIEPARKVLGDVSQQAGSLVAERSGSLASSGSLSRPSSPSRTPSGSMPVATPLASAPRPSKLGPSGSHDGAPWASKPAAAPEVPQKPSAQPSGPARSAWGLPIPVIPVSPAIPVPPPPPPPASRPSGNGSASLSRSYSLWGAHSLHSGDASIWQHGLDHSPTWLSRPPSATRPNAWAVPLTAAKPQPPVTFADWKQPVQESHDVPMTRSTSFSLFSHSGSVSSTASLEAHLLQGSSPSDTGHYQLFGAGHSIQAPSLSLLQGLPIMRSMGIHV